MRSIAFLRATSLTTLAAMALVAACSNGNDRPAPGGGQGASSSSASSSSGSSGTSGGGGEGGADDGAAPANLCEGPKQESDLVQELRIASDAPTPLGGAMPQGTFVLSEANAYGPPQSTDAGDSGEQASPTGPTGISVRSTLIVTATTIRFVSARGPAASVPPDAVAGFTYAINGSSIVATPACPAGGSARTIPFSAVGGGLALFVDATHRETYRPR